jgi:hypothetical protein
LKTRQNLHLPGGFQFPDLLDTLHAFGQLRIVDDSRFAGGLDDGSGLVHAVQVGGAAKVLAAVFGVDPSEVHGDVTKVVNWSKSVFCKEKCLEMFKHDSSRVYCEGEVFR